MEHKNKFKKKNKNKSIEVYKIESIRSEKNIIIDRAVKLKVFDTNIKLTVKWLITWVNYNYNVQNIMGVHGFYHRGVKIDDMNDNQLITTLNLLLNTYEKK